MSDDSNAGSPLRPKRKVRKALVLSSSSSSDSDESIETYRTRKKKLRVVSDSDSSDSGSSDVLPAGRRKNVLPKLRESDIDSDGSGSASDHSSVKSKKPSPSAVNSSAPGFASDSSEGNSDKCSICLLRFTNQEIGTPQSCEHIFCLDCITEWANNVNTCPVDRISFTSIVVRSRIGGRVVRTEPVKVVERRPSVELLVVEDPTLCQVCGRSDGEETMLLCDGCDLGFHMRCLNPPLQEIPTGRWYCPNCVDENYAEFLYFSELDLLSDIQDIEPSVLPLRSQMHFTRQRPRNNVNNEQPSTSSGGTSQNLNINQLAMTSGRAGTTRRQTTTSNKRRKSRKTKRKKKAIVLEYEVEGDGKFPIKKRTVVKRKAKKRKVKKRQPRTAARRSYVRASVRARLATLKKREQELAKTSECVQSLAHRRYSAGIPTLNLFGNSNELDYISGDEFEFSVGPTAGVALRPTSSILSAYRQTRRKMICLSSPPHVSSAPDILSSILESQSLLHSKKSVTSVTVDGQVKYKLQKQSTTNNVSKQDNKVDKEDKLDLTNANDFSKKTPSYPGQNRGGGWGGGYRGNYNRDQNSNNFNRSGNNYDNNSYGGNYQARHGNPHSYQNMNTWREENNAQSNYIRRPNQYIENEPFLDRPNWMRRSDPSPLNRGPSFRPVEQNRPSIGTSWRPYSNDGGFRRQERYEHSLRENIAGFEDPLDMRVGQSPVDNLHNNPVDLYGDIEPIQESALPESYDPLPEPPVFRFDKFPEPDKSEDERSDSGLVIDTDKYDPTEPTHDESSGEDENRGIASGTTAEYPTGLQRQSEPVLPSSSTDANLPNTLQVPPVILNKAVQQVLQEHRNLIVPKKMHNKSDDESDGDCPNFSIYSATSVHIASGASDNILPRLNQQNDIPLPSEDLVQEDDDVQDSLTTNNIEENLKDNNIEVKDTPSPGTKPDLDYNEKISRRCPITPNKRNPIKIKIQTTTLIKRHVLDLYDEDEEYEKNFESDKDKVDAFDEKLQSPPLPINPIEKSCERKIKSAEDSDIPKFDKLSSTSDKNLDENDDDIKTPENDNLQTDDISQSSIEDKNENKKNSREKYIHKDNSNNKEDIKNDYDSENNDAISDNDLQSDIETDALYGDLDINLNESKKDSSDKNDENLEKMTESISETEDERSYTPCLDENKSKDTSMETEKENIGLEGLDTEMISEGEENAIFSDNDNKNDKMIRSVQKEVPPGDQEEGEIVEKRKEMLETNEKDDGKKKKRKEIKITKDKSKAKGKKGELAFKKLSKIGKERNYRDKDKDKDDKFKNKKERRKSFDKDKSKKKEKRKDLERYDVRTVVTEKRRRVKDAFGRDISPRQHTKSPSPLSPLTRQISLSPVKNRSRSLSPGRMRSRSLSRDKHTPSVMRRPISRRSISRNRSSLSRIRKSISPKLRSITPRRTPLSPRFRSTSPRRRSVSVRRRSVSIRRRSSSPRRSPVLRRRRKSGSPRRIRRSLSRKLRRSISPRRRTLSPRPRPISRGRKRIRRSPSKSPKIQKSSRKKNRLKRRSISRGRSPSPKMKKSRRNKRRSKSPRRKSPKQKKRKLRSVTSDLVLSPERIRDEMPPAWIPAKSPMYRPWSRSVSRSINSRLISPSWTPPRDMSPEPRHLRVILANNEKARKKERKRRQRELEKARHNKELSGPSKEVFTSGNNILVSVSFNKKDQDEEVLEDDLIGKKRKRRTEGKKKEKRRKKTNKTLETENSKPVAIIDLEKSPFRELTPSPKNVIVLSDSDHGEKENTVPRSEVRDVLLQEHATQTGPIREQTFLSSVGPKTPPEPAVKFSILSKPLAQLRAVNPLHEAEQASEKNQQNEGEKTHKGPNTPPDPPNSPPSSPDAYDPFEPTKSGSVTPEPASAQADAQNDESQEKTTITLETAQKTNLSADDVVNQRPISPIEKVMALLQSTHNVSPTQIPDNINRDNQDNEEPVAGNTTNQSPEAAILKPTQHFASSASIAPTVVTSAPVYFSTAIPRIGVFTNASSPQRNPGLTLTSSQRIVLPSPTKSSPLKSQQPKLFLAKPSPIKSNPIKPLQSTKISKLPMPNVKPVTGIRKQKNGSRTDSAINDVIDLEMDMDSPYSPGSSDFGDLFNPPSELNASKPYSKQGNKTDLFDSLFGSKPIMRVRHKSSATKVPVKQIKKKGKTHVGIKIDEDNLKILDDLPSSAVEMQVKSKFLKKLNRQERVVEEVKLVLKPHYNKKHVTKEEYKDILRRAVPKICHNKTGEINPTKIQALVEAYVRKCRKKHKLGL